MAAWPLRGMLGPGKEHGPAPELPPPAESRCHQPNQQSGGSFPGDSYPSPQLGDLGWLLERRRIGLQVSMCAQASEIPLSWEGVMFPVSHLLLSCFLPVQDALNAGFGISLPERCSHPEQGEASLGDSQHSPTSAGMELPHMHFQSAQQP